MPAKEEVRKISEALPDDATWEDVQCSKLVDHDEIETRMKRWLDE